MVALIDGEDEQRVRLVDSVRGQTDEEFLERRVVVAELLCVSGLTGTICEMDVAGCSMRVVRVGDVRVGDGDSGFLHLGDPGKRNSGLHPVEAWKADMPVLILDRVAVKVSHRTAQLNHRIDVLGAEESLETVVAARLVGQEVGPPVVGSAADRGALCAVDADADEVRERLGCRHTRPVGGCLDSLGRTRTEDCRDVDPGVLKNRVCGRHRAKVAPCTGVGNPRCGGDLPVLVDHLRCQIRLSRGREWRPGRAKEWRRPVRERDAGAARPCRCEVAEGVRNRLAHPVGIDASERRQDPGRGVGNQRCVIVSHQNAVVRDEIEQVRHLFEIRGYVRVVSPKVRVVELDVDHMLDSSFR